MSAAAVSLDIAAPRATITLNRPERHNALAIADLEAFAAALGIVHETAGVRVLIVTGTGAKSFCSGVSLGDVATGDWSSNPLSALCDGLEQFPLPTICALNGGVYGGGVEIALACDFRIGVTGMTCFIPPARLGIHYEPSGIARAMRRVGAQMARRLFLGCETLDAGQMLACGLVDEIAEPDALAVRAGALADRLAGFAPLAVQGMKRTIVELSENRLDAAAARDRIAGAWASDDLREGLAAMREKRPPNFSGR